MSSKPIGVVVLILVIFGAGVYVVSSVPLIEVEYTIEVPTNSTDSHTDNVFTGGTSSLEDGYYRYTNERLIEGRNYEFSFGASGLVDAYIFTSNQYVSYSNGLLDEYEGVLRSTRGTIEFTPTETAR